MEYFVKCTGPQSAVCLKCGSAVIFSKNQTIGHCGHCGCLIQIEFAEKVVVREEPPKHKEWVQMTMFE